MERVAWVAQQPERQLFARTVAEDVAAGLVPRGVPPEARRERAARWLDRLGLPPGEFLERPVHALSGGEARKVALAGTLVLERPVLVLDEPSAGLDDPSRCLLWELLAGLKREGTSLVVISHHLMELAHLADRLLVVDGGRTAYLGTWEDLPGELPGGSCLERPPLHQLMRRLGRARPGLPAAVAGPEAAAAVIRPLLAGNQSSPKTSAS
jgi:energy-coupling factor transport system ATP-binding protein